MSKSQFSALEKELALLNETTKQQRLDNLIKIDQEFKERKRYPCFSEEVNNHVHSIYSFSPYSPTAIAFMARMAGLKAVGIMDHDSVEGALEMIEACKIIGIMATVGCELRVNMNSTSVEGLRTNNPDSKNISYIALHGIPHPNLEKVSLFLASLRIARNKRNEKETHRLNELIKDTGVEPLDFKRDVLILSESNNGGGVTERHILYAFAGKLIKKFGKGQLLIDFLTTKLLIEVSQRQQEILLDQTNIHYQYDLLGLLKASFVDDIFIQPNHLECLNVFDVIKFALEIGAIPCYAYLGDVESSVTGDKKVQKFEDEFLDELIIELVKIGFQAITYMPPRNTMEQLNRLKKLCEDNGLLEISGVDINSSRQSFNSPEVMLPEYRHLVDITWALVEHEWASSQSLREGFFSKQSNKLYPNLKERIDLFSRRGQIRFSQQNN